MPWRCKIVLKFPACTASSQGRAKHRQGATSDRDVEVLDQLANGATRQAVNGEQKGDDIGDVAFYPALLRIWLGVRPADHDLRDALLRSSR